MRASGSKRPPRNPQWERAWRQTFDNVDAAPGATPGATPSATPGVASAGMDAATNTYRYDMKDVVLYVLTLCAVALVGSLVAELTAVRALGVQFVVGWFALDLCWSPESKFVRVQSVAEYASFAVSTALSVVAWWMWGDDTGFAVVQIVLAVGVAVYWVATELPRKPGLWYRGCVRALLLYGFVTVLAMVVARVAGVAFVVHPWYVAFVLNALATTRRGVRWWDRALHGWTWGVLLEALARDELVFDKFFYK